MTNTLLAVFVVSAFFVFWLVLAMRSVLSENRKIDNKTDYSKLRHGWMMKRLTKNINNSE